MRAWASTVIQSFLAPQAVFHVSRLDTESLVLFLMRNIAVATSLIAVPWTYFNLLRPVRRSSSTLIEAVVWLPIAVAIMLLVTIGVGIAIGLLLWALGQAIVECWAKILGVRSGSPAPTVVGIIASSVYPIAVLALISPVLFATPNSTALEAIAYFLLPLLLAGALWLRIVHIGLRELRYANPPPLAHETEIAASAVE